jgi:hypothetical protein
LSDVNRKIGQSLAQFCNAATIERARQMDFGVRRDMGR